MTVPNHCRITWILLPTWCKSRRRDSKRFASLRHPLPRCEGVLQPLLLVSAPLHLLATSPPCVQRISSYAIFHPQCHMHSMRTKLSLLTAFQRTQRVSRPPLNAHTVSSASHRMQSICRMSLVNACKCSETVRQPKTSTTVSVLHIFSWRSVDVSRRFDPANSTEFFRHATSHCAEFAADRFTTQDCSVTLIRAAATCQRFALYYVGSPATLPEFKDQHRDCNAPLNPCNDRHGSTHQRFRYRIGNPHDFP